MCRLCSLLGGCLVALIVMGQATAQDPKKKEPKEIDVKAPRIAETPPTLPAPGETVPGFTFNGSPLGDLNASTSSVTGAPATLFDLPHSISSLDLPRISQQIPLSTPEILEMMPGVYIQRTNQGGGSVILRGRNGNQNLIMVDGVPINDAGWRFANVQYLNTIDPGVIERIEVIRGPGSVLYGSGAMGGVVNIITKSRKDFSQTMDLGGGVITRFSSALQESYNRVEVQGNFRNLGVFAGGSYLTNGALFAGQGVNFPSFATGYDQRAADLRLDYHLGDGWVLTFAYQHLLQPNTPRTDRFPLPQIDPTRFVNRPTFFQDQERNFGYLRLSRFSDIDVINGLQLTLSLQQRREIENELRLDRKPNERNISLDDVLYGGIDLRAFTDFSERHTLTYGATYQHDTVDSTRRRSTDGDKTFKSRTPAIPPDGEYDQFGIFILDRLEIADWLALTGGVRYSNINARGTTGAGDRKNEKFFTRAYDDWSSEFGLVAALTDELHWVGSIREGFRAPNLEDLGSNDRSHAVGQDFGSIGLEPERVTSFETGFKYRSGVVQFNGAYFYDHIESQIVRRQEKVGKETANIRTNTRGILHGVELEGLYFLTPRWSLFTTGTQLFGQDTSLDEPLSRVPPAFATLGSRWTYQAPRCGLFLEAFAELSDGQDRLSSVDKSDIRFPVGGESAWQTFNLRGGLDMRRYGRLTMGLYNVFDQNYRYSGSGVDAPGIDFRVGYELQF